MYFSQLNAYYHRISKYSMKLCGFAEKLKCIIYSINVYSDRPCAVNRKIVNLAGWRRSRPRPPRKRGGKASNHPHTLTARQISNLSVCLRKPIIIIGIWWDGGAVAFYTTENSRSGWPDRIGSFPQKREVRKWKREEKFLMVSLYPVGFKKISRQLLKVY